MHIAALPLLIIFYGCGSTNTTANQRPSSNKKKPAPPPTLQAATTNAEERKITNEFVASVTAVCKNLKYDAQYSADIRQWMIGVLDDTDKRSQASVLTKPDPTINWNTSLEDAMTATSASSSDNEYPTKADCGSYTHYYGALVYGTNQIFPENGKKAHYIYGWY